MNVLTVENLKKSYKRGFIPRSTPVLKGIGFSVAAGTVTGFLGANGAGKTTTMRCLLGLDFPDAGSINFFGKPLDVSARKRIGFLPERPYFYEHLSGREFLTFYANLSGHWPRKKLDDRIKALLSRVDLLFAVDRPLRNYSKGMLQKIGLAQALIHEPEFVILDEPMSGLDPDGRMALAEIILETAKMGTAVFFSSHLLHDMERLCSQLVVMKDGLTIFEGTTEALLETGGVDFELIYLANGERLSQRCPSAELVQPILAQLLQSGATVLEVRRHRSSLEDIFVKLALKGSRR
jgi:ABC-2 type transport system ATP-binding protein